jgi:ABC-type transport system involved in multi-copper enzyme maturation permease subunit
MRYALADVWSSRITVVLCLLCLGPALISLATIYIMNNETVRALLNNGTAGNPIAIDERFFLVVLQTHCWPALVLTAWVGPWLVSIDMTNTALPILLSHPVSRVEYVLAKFSVLAGFLSAVTWVPALLLFTLQSYLSAKPWALQNMHIAVGMFIGSLIWIVLLSLIALATAAWVKWRIVATGMVFAAVFVPAGVAGVFNAVMRTDWGNVVNIPLMMSTLWRRLLQVEYPAYLTRHEIPTLAILVALALICAGCVAALNARIRAREVVRG